MAARDTSDVRCSIARSLEVLGERWTLLVIREAFRGRSRFAEFRDALGVAPDVLSARLKTLVEAGVLERRAYREPGERERSSYHLTESGRELRLVLGALNQWGDRYRPSGHGPASILQTVDGAPARVTFVDPTDSPRPGQEIVTVPGPGARR